MAGQHLDTDNGGGGGGGDCACDITEIDVHEAETLNLTLTDPDVGKVYINVTGAGATINFPELSTVVNRGIEVYIICGFTGVITLMPAAGDSLGDSGVNVTLTGNVRPGDGGMFWVGNVTYWGILGSSGGGGGGGGFTATQFMFSTTAAKLTYTLAEVTAALVSGAVSNLTGKTLLVHLNGTSYVSGGGSVSINGSGGIDFSFNPGTSSCVVQII